MCDSNLSTILKFVGTILKLIEIIVPILLIVMGTIDFMKAVMAGKDDEFKKSQSTFLKRCIVAAMVFLVPTIVGLLLSVLNITKSSCMTCVLNTSTCNVNETNSTGNINDDNESNVSNNSCSTLLKEQCNSNTDCIWTDMTRFGSQFDNLNTNGYYCTKR